MQFHGIAGGRTGRILCRGRSLWRRSQFCWRMRVEFVYDVDKEAFREATQPMIEAYEEEYPGVKTLLDTIDAARGEE